MRVSGVADVRARGRLSARRAAAATAVAVVTSSLCAGADVRRGRFTLKFSEQSPLSQRKEFFERTGLPSDGAGLSYDIRKERFDVYVPYEYWPETPHGLLIWIACNSRVWFPERWEDCFDERGLILIRVPHAPHQFARRALALDAASNMCNRYSIDPDRIYIGGESVSGAIATELSIQYADVFTGLFNMHGRIDEDISPRPDPAPGRAAPTEEERDRQWASYPREQFDLARKRSRFVFAVGEHHLYASRNKPVFDEIFGKGKFANASYCVLPGIGGIPPGLESFGDLLSKLDGPIRRQAIGLLLKGGRLEEKQNLLGAGACYARAAYMLDRRASGAARQKLKAVLSRTGRPELHPDPKMLAARMEPKVASPLGMMTRHGIFRSWIGERSPLSTRKMLVTRCSDALAKRHDYDPEWYEATLYIPDTYRPGVPHGLAVWGWYAGSRPSEFLKVLKSQKLIGIGIRSTMRDLSGMGIMLDAVHNMRKQYCIDPERIYVGGRTGASIMGLAYPDVFTGTITGGIPAACYEIGPGGDSGVLWAWMVKRPRPELLRLAKRHSRYVFIFASERNVRWNRSRDDRTIYETQYKRGGFVGLSDYEMDDDILNASLPKEILGKALADLDAPLRGDVRKALERGVKHEESARPGDALLEFSRAEQFGGQSGPARLASVKMAALQKALRADMDAALATVRAKRWTEALAELEQVVDKWGKGMSAPASLLIERISASPLIRGRAERAARKKAEGARELEAATRLGKILDRVDKDIVAGFNSLKAFATRYKGTAAGREAEAEMARLEKGSKLTRARTAAKSGAAARGLLSTARNYLANGMNGPARLRLKRILDEYPETPEARQAESLLKKLGGK